MLRTTESEPQDEGFTLIELLLCVALLGIIGAAIAGSMLVMLETKQRSTQMLAVSQDRQFLSSYFSDDVAGAATVTEGSATVCGTAMTSLVILKGADIDPATTTSAPTTTAWSWVSGSRSLVRTSCRDGGPANTRTVARNVPSAPTVSGSCTSSVSISSDPKPAAVRISVPQASGSALALCAVRRPE